MRPPQPRHHGRARRWLLALVALFALSPAACDKSETLARIESPIEAELAFETTKTVGGSGNHFVCSPRIITSESLELTTGDRRVSLPDSPKAGRPAQLISDEAGRRLAYRLGDNPWRVVYVGKTKLLVAPDSLLVRAAEVDFKNVPALDRAAPAIFRESAKQQRDLLAEFSTLGPDALASLLVATFDAPAAPDDLWEKAFNELPPPQKASVQQALRKATAARTPVPQLLRLTRVARIDTPALAIAALSAADAAGKEGDQYGTASAVLAQAALIDAKTAAGHACNWLGDPHRKDVRTAALLAIAADRAACDKLPAALAGFDACARELRCGAEIRHDSPLCTADEAAQRARAALDAIAKWDDSRSASPESALAAAALASAAPDERLRLANARRAYRAVQTGESCEVAEHAAEACRCDAAALFEAACKAPDSKSWVENCNFTIDDAARSIRDIKAIRTARSTLIAAGSDIGCAVLLDGSVECWGEGAPSMLPEDERTPSPTFGKESSWVRSAERRRAKGIRKASSVAAGRGSACTLVEGGDVHCFGQLGAEGSKAPRKILSGAVDVALGDSHACAVLSSGEVECWGHNDAGQLGATTRELRYSTEALRVAGIAGAEQLSCALQHCCAKIRDLRLICWGGHANQPDATFLTPEPVEGALEVKSFDVWSGGGCAVLKFGGIACWKRALHARAVRSIESIESAAMIGALEKGVVVLADGKATFHPLTGPASAMKLEQPIGAIAVSNSSVLPHAYALLDDGRIARLELPYSAH
jgi:hypothetical protein